MCSPRPDWGGTTAFVVMFDHDEPMLPPGGEFTADRLTPIQPTFSDAA
jgi:hypothetical protein